MGPVRRLLGAAPVRCRCGSRGSGASPRRSRAGRPATEVPRGDRMQATGAMRGTRVGARPASHARTRTAPFTVVRFAQTAHRSGQVCRVPVPARSAGPWGRCREDGGRCGGSILSTRRAGAPGADGVEGGSCRVAGRADEGPRLGTGRSPEGRPWAVPDGFGRAATRPAASADSTMPRRAMAMERGDRLPGVRWRRRPGS